MMNLYNDEERERAATIRDKYRLQNRLTLMAFVNYCAQNPDLRFWQALASWSGQTILAVPAYAWANRVLYECGRLNLYDFVTDTWEWRRRNQ